MKKLWDSKQSGSEKALMPGKFFVVFMLAILITLGGACTPEKPAQEAELPKEGKEAIGRGQLEKIEQPEVKPSEVEWHSEYEKELAAARAIEIELLERTAAEMKEPLATKSYKRREEIALSPAASQLLKKHLHKDAVICDPGFAGYYAISPTTAMLWAIKRLERKGAEKIEICEVEHWVAGFGVYWVNGKFEYTESTAAGYKNYSIFRIGILDGSEGGAGEGSLRYAKGVDEKGKTVWYPPHGPDAPVDGLAYEWLGDQEKFESIPQRFK